MAKPEDEIQSSAQEHYHCGLPTEAWIDDRGLREEVKTREQTEDQARISNLLKVEGHGDTPPQMRNIAVGRSQAD